MVINRVSRLVLGGLLPTASNNSNGLLLQSDYKQGVAKILSLGENDMWQITESIYVWKKYFVDFEFISDNGFGKVVLTIEVYNDTTSPIVKLINIKNGAGFPFTIYRKNNTYYVRRDGASMNGSCSISSVSSGVQISSMGNVGDVSSYTKISLTAQD